MPNVPDQAITVRAVAGYLNVQEKTVYRLAKRRDLPDFKVVGAWVAVQAIGLDDWIDRRRRLRRPSSEGSKWAI